jgi:hypothetical protein
MIAVQKTRYAREMYRDHENLACRVWTAAAG